MSTSKTTSRRRRTMSLSPDALETRQLLTGGAGNTFAIEQATITKPNEKIVVPFTLTNSLITLQTNKFVLGIDVAKNTSSTVLPKIVGLEDLTTHKMIPLQHTKYTPAVAKLDPTQGGQATAVLATLKFPSKLTTQHKYAVMIAGNQKSTGALLVGFYLPGDTTGDGTVQSSDINSLKGLQNVPASSSNYNFAADANRDGIINANDLKIAQENLGAVVLVSPVVSANLSPTTDTGYPAETTSTQTVLYIGQATPGATITFTDSNTSVAPVSTVANSTGNYSINIKLAAGANTFGLTSTDAFGQTITGQISPVTYTPGVAPNLTAAGAPVSSTAKPTTT